MEWVLGFVYYNRFGYGVELMDCDVWLVESIICILLELGERRNIDYFYINLYFGWRIVNCFFFFCFSELEKIKCIRFVDRN